jgi:replication factor A1
MLATQLNELITTGKLFKNTIIRLEKYVANTVGAKKILILLNLTTLTEGEHIQKVGLPNPLAEQAQGQAQQRTSVPTNQPTSVPTNHQKPKMAKQPTPKAPTPGIMMIKSLNPYQNRWTIKARVLSKPPIKTWKNAKGEGKLFSVILADESGEIKATGFKESVDQFYDLLQIDKAYLISGCTLKVANKQFNTTNNDYEMGIDQNSTFVEVFYFNKCDDTDMPGVKYEFKEISRIADMEVNGLVDLMAVIKEQGEVQDLMSKAQKPLKKRELTLVDMSGSSIRLTLWGEQAMTFPGGNPVVAFKGLKISDFGGRSLGCGFDSTFQIEPDMPEAHNLRGWYESGGNVQSFNSFTGQGGHRPSTLITIKQVVDDGLGLNEKVCKTN